MRFWRYFYRSTLSAQTRFLQFFFLLIASPVLVLGAAGRSIEETESWRIAIFFAVVFFLSMILEYLFHNLEHYLESIHETGILATVHKMKEELMLLGFISLLLIILEDSLVRVCIPNVFGDSEQYWIPCCNTRPNPSVVNLIEDRLQTCIKSFTKRSDAGVDYIPKQYVKYVKDCNAQAVASWDTGIINGSENFNEGYSPLSKSELMKVCPRPGQNKYATHPSEQHDFECPYTDDGTETYPFMSINAMHQLHTLIFLTAVSHIIYSAMIMFVSQHRVKKWTRWEYYGDDEDEKLEELHTPPRYPNCFIAVFAGIFEQCFRSVDPLTYISVRRFYIVRNNLPKDFNFNKQLVEVHLKDFQNLVGVSSWMWVLIIILVLLDGVITSDVRMFKMLNTFVAIILCIIAGTKLLFVFRDVVNGVLKKLGFDHKKTGTTKVTKEELDALQSSDIEDHSIFDDVDAHFWCASCNCCGKKRKFMGDSAPTFMLGLIRCTMFQNSFTLAQILTNLVFSLDHAQQFDQSCFYKSRGPVIIVLQIIAFLIMFSINGLVTVPLYSICAITTHHRTLGTDLHKHYHTVRHTLIDEIRIITKTLSEGPPEPEPEAEAKSEEKEEAAALSLGPQTAVPGNESGEGSAASKVPMLPVKAPKKETFPINKLTAFAFHAREAMLKQRLEKTKRELSAMRTMRMHSAKQGDTVNKQEEEEHRTTPRVTQVAPEGNDDVEKQQNPEAKQQPEQPTRARKRRSVFNRGSVTLISKSVKAIAALPLVKAVTMTILLMITIILLSTVSSYINDYGYYVPHWTYQGWGGPQYWKKLTDNDDNVMSTYNNNNKDEWTVSEDNKDYVDDFGNCRSNKACVSYVTCENGTYQSPININAWSWKNKSQNANSQYRNATQTKTLGELFTPDIKTKFVPVYYHEQLKFYCKSENTTEYKCGVFKWNERKYKLKYFKIHTPSEHTFDNIKNGMEIQFVMEEKNADEGQERTLALAVLFDVGTENSTSIRAIDKLFGNATADELTGHNKYKNLQDAKIGNKKVYASLGGDKSDKSSMNATEKVNLGDIIHEKSSFFHYKGSDTSPPCEEGYDGKGMDWFIQKDIVHMTEAQWQGIYDFFAYPGNSRPTIDIDLNPERIITFYGDVNSINTITSFGVDW